MLLQSPPLAILGRPIETDFRKWLRFSVMWQSKDLTTNEKINLSLLNILGEATCEPDKALIAIFDFYLCGKECKGDPPCEKLLDWEKDGSCVWADFRIYAGIDLNEIHLHWWAFMALFECLPPESGIKRRIEIRGMDLSKIKDPETREEYRKAKEAISLEDYNEDWDAFYRKMK